MIFMAIFVPMSAMKKHFWTQIQIYAKFFVIQVAMVALSQKTKKLALHAVQISLIFCQTQEVIFNIKFKIYLECLANGLECESYGKGNF